MPWRTVEEVVDAMVVMGTHSCRRGILRLCAPGGVITDINLYIWSLLRVTLILAHIYAFRYFRYHSLAFFFIIFVITLSVVCCVPLLDHLFITSDYLLISS